MLEDDETGKIITDLWPLTIQYLYFCLNSCYWAWLFRNKIFIINKKFFVTTYKDPLFTRFLQVDIFSRFTRQQKSIFMFPKIYTNVANFIFSDYLLLPFAAVLLIGIAILLPLTLMSKIWWVKEHASLLKPWPLFSHLSHLLASFVLQDVKKERAKTLSASWEKQLCRNDLVLTLTQFDSQLLLPIKADVISYSHKFDSSLEGLKWLTVLLSHSGNLFCKFIDAEFHFQQGLLSVIMFKT